MKKINNENLEKISGGKADSEKSPSSNIDVTKLRQGKEMTCWRCGKKFRLGDAEIFHTECNQCRSGGIIESFNKMKGEKIMTEVNNENLEKISGGKAEVANGRARHFIYTCPICGKTRNVTRYGCFMTRFEPICSDCKSKYDNDKLSELWKNSTIKNCMVEIKDNKADTTESK